MIWESIKLFFSQIKNWKIYLGIIIFIIVLYIIWKYKVYCDREYKKQQIDKFCAEIPESESIFISIPSYRDPECAKTLFDLFEKADCPFRITVGVCQQNYEMDGSILEDYKSLSKNGVHDFSNRIRIHEMDASEAQGPMLARHLIEKHLYRNEKYYFMTDSHMLFTPGWDREIVRQFKLCQKWSAKPILTCYPDDFKSYHRIWPGSNYDNKPGTYLRFKKFNEKSGLVEIEGPLFLREPKNPQLGMFWGACFSFGLATQIKEVPFDPHCPYVFLGEEISMAARLWTSGYDFYHPSKTIVYHMWDRPRPTFWQQFDRPTEEHEMRRQMEQEGYERIQRMFGIVQDNQTIAPPYAMGTFRSLDEYQKFIGLNMRRGMFLSLSGLMGIPDYSKSPDVLCRFGTWKNYKNIQEKIKLKWDLSEFQGIHINQ